MPDVVVRVFGEGKTDIGGSSRGTPATGGVVPILLAELLNRPKDLSTEPRRMPFLPGKTLRQKVKFARRQAFYDRLAGVVFVMDTDGKNPDKMRAELNAGREGEFPQLATAVGVAHPCIEAWLLADSRALTLALKLSSPPTVPQAPEELPAPAKNKQSNPKTVLRDIAGVRQKELEYERKNDIARRMRDMDLVCMVCPRSFAPFATEVRERLGPLFAPAG